MCQCFFLFSMLLLWPHCIFRFRFRFSFFTFSFPRSNHLIPPLHYPFFSHTLSFFLSESLSFTFFLSLFIFLLPILISILICFFLTLIHSFNLPKNLSISFFLSFLFVYQFLFSLSLSCLFSAPPTISCHLITTHRPIITSHLFSPNIQQSRQFPLFIHNCSLPLVFVSQSQIWQRKGKQKPLFKWFYLSKFLWCLAKHFFFCLQHGFSHHFPPTSTAIISLLKSDADIQSPNFFNVKRPFFLRFWFGFSFTLFLRFHFSFSVDLSLLHFFVSFRFPSTLFRLISVSPLMILFNICVILNVLSIYLSIYLSA